MASGTLHRLNTVNATVGHAHPAVPMESHGLASVSSLFDLVSSVNFDVVIRGLPNEDLSAASALLFPFVRRSSQTTEAAQHLDTVSCWKGLSPSQSGELSVWERLFKESMALQIREHLQRDFASQLQDYTDPENEMLLVSRMADFLTHEQSSMINISMSRLVDNMISLLYSDRRGETTKRTMDWSLSSQELPSLVYNLVRLHDCFIHTLTGPKVLFAVSQSYARGVLTAFVNVRWQPPRIIFSGLPSQILEGDPYRITPRFASINLCAAGNNNRFRCLEDEVTYTVTKSSLPLLWDDTEQCFHVPDNQEETRSGAHETILSARIITQFQGGVRFETQSRYNIKVGVYGDKEVNASCEDRNDICDGLELQEDIPAWLDSRLERLVSTNLSKPLTPKLCDEQPSWLPSVTINPVSTTNQYTSRNTPSSGTVHRARRDSGTRSPCALPTPPATEGNTGSPGKRKVSCVDDWTRFANESYALEKVKLSGAEFDTKRRKLGLDHHEVLSTEAATYWGHSPENDSVPSSPTRSAGGPALPKLIIPSPTSSGASSSPVDICSPPAAASTTSSTNPLMLTQEQIQLNYREFEERQIRKAAERAYYAATIPGFDGVVSPTDVNDNSFERIFIEHSEGDDETED